MEIFIEVLVKVSGEPLDLLKKSAFTWKIKLTETEYSDIITP